MYQIPSTLHYTVYYIIYMYTYTYIETHIHIPFSSVSKVLDIGHNYFLKCVSHTGNKHVKTFFYS